MAVCCFRRRATTSAAPSEGPRRLATSSVRQTKDSAQKNVSVFGYGTFDYDGKNKSIETMMNSTFLSTKGKTYDVAIEMNGRNAYRQTITFANGDRSIEYYERITN